MEYIDELLFDATPCTSFYFGLELIVFFQHKIILSLFSYKRQCPLEQIFHQEYHLPETRNFWKQEGRV